MTSGMKTVIYPVRDIEAAKARFTELLGVPPHTDQPYYVGYRVGDQEVALDPNGHSQGMTGTVAYWHVDDIEKSRQMLVDAGGQEQQAIRDVGGGRLTAIVTDADGNVIGLLQDPT
jgi:predicted enzyme related to lactoylglutathione lyase